MPLSSSLRRLALIVPFVTAIVISPGCSESGAPSAPPQLPPTQRATATSGKAAIKDAVGPGRSDPATDSTLHPTK